MEPSLEARWKRLVSGETRGVGSSLARGGLTVLSWIYGLGLSGNLAIYRWGLKPHIEPALPTLSVGNLTVGGTGKTTAVRFLARLLAGQGLRPGVVLRGHGRRDGSPVLLVSDGERLLASVDEAGDEALELAGALPGCPVAVGKRRERVIELLKASGATVALLDDGYQYFRMSRRVNIALLSAAMDLQAARLLPRGVLREPWPHLGRADQVWITHADRGAPDTIQRLREIAARHAPDAPVVLARHAPQALLRLSDGSEASLAELNGRRVLAFSGLGSPESFEDSLRRAGATVAPLRFADHYRYGATDWERIAAMAGAEGADLIVTTEKDAVKLEGCPLEVHVLRSELEIIEGQEALAGLVAAVEKQP